MPPALLWIYFLGDQSANDVRPTVWVGGPEGHELVLSDRARALVAALAVPPEMASGPRWTSGELSTWSSGDVLERMRYGHRRAIQDAIGDLEKTLGAHDLELAHYLHADKARGRYGLNNVRVDAVEVIDRRDDPDQLSALLSGYTRDPVNAGFSVANEHLWSAAARQEVGRVLSAAGARAPGGGLETAPARDETERRLTAPADQDDAGGAAPSLGRRPGRLGRAAFAMAVAALLVVAAIVGVLLATSGGGSMLQTGRTWVEVPGGLAHTWTDYATAQGTAGPSLRAQVPVRVSCRIRGLQVNDGNVWWYRIASAPWSNRFYATGDAFYNNGKRSGPLRGTPFFDRAVPSCQ